MEPDLIYFDNNATTRTDSRVVEAMLPFFTEYFGNASSNHRFGLKVKQFVENSREQVAGFINAKTNDILFTSGGTESINLGLIGYAIANQHKGKRIITCSTEHKAVLDSCKYLESVGFEVVYVPVDKSGIINIEIFKNTLNKETILVCIMLANNETGVIQPVEILSELSHNNGAVFMCDATQALGKIPCDVIKLGIDILTYTGHKFYGPKGIGGIYINGYSNGQLQIESLQYGGKQENGLRSGTLNVPGIVGMGKACEIAKLEMQNDETRIRILRDTLEEELLKISKSFVNGDKHNRLHNTTNICFSGQDANVLIGRMKNVAASTGAACSSAIVEPSHVLKAMGLKDDDANASIRFSLGKYNALAEVEKTINLMYQLLKNN